MYEKVKLFLRLDRARMPSFCKSAHLPTELVTLVVFFTAFLPVTDQTIRPLIRRWCQEDPSYNWEAFGPIEYWDVSQVTDMSDLFCADGELVYGFDKFNNDLSRWNVSQVTKMNWLFWGLPSFNQPLASWDVSQVTEMQGMFCCARQFNQPLESWDVRNVRTMNLMFKKASMFNQPLDKWNVKRGTKKREMFDPQFNQSLDSWEVPRPVPGRFMWSWGAEDEVCLVKAGISQKPARPP